MKRPSVEFCFFCISWRHLSLLRLVLLFIYCCALRRYFVPARIRRKHAVCDILVSPPQTSGSIDDIVDSNWSASFERACICVYEMFEPGCELGKVSVKCNRTTWYRTTSLSCHDKRVGMCSWVMSDFGTVFVSHG